MSRASEWVEKAQWVEENRLSIEIGSVKIHLDSENNICFMGNGMFRISMAEAQQFCEWIMEISTKEDAKAD